MTEKKIYIKNGSLIIEGLLSKASTENGVVICHPHSLMGGSMYNNVVEAIQEAFSAENYSTMRFNFRGVGGSSGYYDEGRGEKEDIYAVCEYLKKTGLDKLYLAGYSFGAWVGSKVLEENKDPFVKSVFVSPPVEYFNFNWDNLNNKINYIICGDCDQFCSINIVKKIAQKINSPLEVIRGVDHFYMGEEKKFVRILGKYIIEHCNK
ncbi:MAG: hypothetical protein APR62_06850 [Smithella sp. SDB]|nr:MAG: hypothetical protein APR62_06850 [Smithella sp. SDB]